MNSPTSPSQGAPRSPVPQIVVQPQGQSRPALKPTAAPINFRSRAIQIRLFIAVGSILGVASLVESYISGRGFFADPASLAASGAREIETRLPAQPKLTLNDLAVITQPPAESKLAQNPAVQASTEAVESDFWSRLFEGLTPKQRDQFQAAIRLAIRATAGEAKSPLGTSDRAGLLRRVTELAAQYATASKVDIEKATDLAPERRAEFLADVEKVTSAWKAEFEPAISAALKDEPLSEQNIASLRAIQHRWLSLALASIEDDQVTPSRDRVAWFGLFDSLQHDPTFCESAAPVTYHELFDQSKQFRARPVVVSGQIRSAAFEPAPNNLYGVKGYYVYWIRPDSHPDAPLKIVALASPFAAEQTAEKSDETASLVKLVGSQCEVRGVFFKRMVYRAQDDIRTVPTILAARVNQWETPSPEESPSNYAGTFVLLVLVGIIAVVLFLLFLFTDKRRKKPLPDKLETPSFPS